MSRLHQTWGGGGWGVPVYNLALPRCCVQVTHELISARCDAPQPPLFGVAGATWERPCTWHLCCALQARTHARCSAFTALPGSSSLISVAAGSDRSQISSVSLHSVVPEWARNERDLKAARVWKAARTPPLNSVCNSGARIPAKAIRRRSEPSRKSRSFTHNYAGQPGGQRDASLTLVPRCKLKDGVLSTSSYLSASVSVAGCAPWGSIACPAVTRFPKVSALPPSSLTLSLFFSSPPSLYFSAGIVTPSKQRPGHYSEAAGTDARMQSAQTPERTRASLELLRVWKRMTISLLHSSTVPGKNHRRFPPLKCHTRAHAFQVLD